MPQLQDRDQEILSALSRRVRLFSLLQVASTWWGEGSVAEANTRRRLSKLTDAGLLRRLRIMALPLPELSKPLIRWEPGDGEPEFGPVAWKLQSRWKETPRKTTVYIATSRASGIYGGRARGELKQEFQATHDLGVSAIYLRLFRLDPASAESWVGEDVLRRYRLGQKIPDAVLADSPAQPPKLVLEFGGAYDVRRLRHFHADCEKKSTPYEIW